MLSASSNAKVNLFLNVVGKRADGYHLLESLFAPLQLADEVSVEPSTELWCEVDGADISENTALKAAKLLQSKFDVKQGAGIRIKKNIPIASGLGGSSTNAATTIKLLSELWKLDLSHDKMREVALEIGADCPFFIDPVTSFVGGVGEEIKPVWLEGEFHILIVYPGFQLTSQDVYKAAQYEFQPKLHDGVNLMDVIIEGGNALEKGAIALKPEIAELLSDIASQEGAMLSRMSGSGSSCFGIFTSEKYALKAKRYFDKSYWTYYEHLKL